MNESTYALHCLVHFHGGADSALCLLSSPAVRGGSVPARLCRALEASRLSAFVQLSWLSVGYGRLLCTSSWSAF